MIRQIATIIFTAVLIFSTADRLAAQRGGGHGGHGGGHAGAGANVSRPAFGVNPGFVNPGFVGRPVIPPVVTPQFFVAPRVPSVGPHIRSHQQFIQTPFVSPFSYSPYLWSSPFYTAPVYSEPAYVAPPVTQNETDLSYQVERLSREIDQLRQEQAAAAVPPPPPPAPSAPAPPPVPTTLVFRDGHRTAIQNFAIVGQTLWVLDENASTRIPLSDLDLDATQRENRGQCARFPRLDR